MVMTIGHVYGRKLTQADAKDLVLELATTAGFGMLARQGIKALLPVVGALLTVPAAFAANWAIGRVAIEYFRNPGTTREQLKKVYAAARAEGGALFSKERFDAFRRGMGGKPAAEAPEEEEAPPDEGEAPDEAPAPDAAADAAAEKERKRLKRLKLRKKVARIIEEEFAARVEQHEDVRDAINGVVHLDITGPSGGLWSVDFTARRDFVSRGLEGEPVLTVRCRARAFIALVEGRRSAQELLAAGELELDPMDLDLAMKLGPLFKA
jgi:hypothetical protein